VPSLRAPEDRGAAVRALLAGRAAAVLAGNRAAFLATVDPRAAAFRARQARLFDALRRVPFASWSYEVDVTPRPLPGRVRYDAPAFSPWVVALRYRLRGYEARPTSVEQHLTFVRRGGRWLLGSDSDFDAAGPKTAREIWDVGPVVAVRGKRSLVLGHPGGRVSLPSLAAEADRDIPRVNAVWGRRWTQQVVVVVPDSTKELARLLDRTPASLRQIAAVATAEVGGAHPVGNRVLVNPTALAGLGALGRQVVMTHEITHVATRDLTSSGAPTWLVEGFADYVAYRGTGVPVRAAADELAGDVRAGRGPTVLPADRDFAGSNPRLARAYESAWLACRLVARRAGEAGLVRLYRGVGPARTGATQARLAGALRSVLGITPAEFTADWRRYVRTQLS
jgi:hypothetical protein